MYKKHNAWILLVALIAFSQKSHAQFVLEPFISEDNLIIESWLFKEIDEQKKFNLFSLNESDYDFDTENSTFLSYSVFGYDWIKGFGPVLGYRFLESYAAALGGIQYAFYKEGFFITVNLTSEFKSDPNIELFSIVQYRKKITSSFTAFTQLQLSTNFISEDHSFSFQRFRVGADLGQFQAGFGLNQVQVGTGLDYTASPGIFLRMELY